MLKYIKIGLEEGGELVTGGERYTENGCDKGFFMKPTILISKTNAARVCQEEIFGPVVVVQKFKTVDEVIELANDSVYGLGGGVFTGSLNTAMKVSRGVQTGRVWVNTYNAIPAGAPSAVTRSPASAAKLTRSCWNITARRKYHDQSERGNHGPL